jgi:NADH-quinone oxidoreductase subunit M
VSVLTLLIVVPLAGALTAWFAGRAGAANARVAALLFSLVEVAIVVQLLFSEGGAARAVITESGRGLLAVWSLTLDGLAMPLVVLTAVLGVVAVLASWRVTDRPGPHMALILILEAMVMGVFLAGDLILFYAFWEAVLIPMFFLIGIWGHDRRRYASMKFFIYTFAASVPMLFAIIVAVLATGSSSMATVLAQLAPALRPAFLLLLLPAFLVKLPAWPFHTWLPDAHVEAPTAGSVLLAGVLLKMGGYGLLRLGLPASPETWPRVAPFVAAIGVIGIVYGAAMALAQSDLKRLVAYSSVSHMGFVLLAVAVGTRLATTGAMIVMVSHGFVSALLFFLVGALYDRTHTREIGRLGGLARQLPTWGTLFVFGALASLGLPGLSGFPGELAALLESWGPFAWLTVGAVFGTVLAAGYNLYAVKRVAFGPLPESWRSLGDLHAFEVAGMAPLVVGVIALGLAPGMIVYIMEPAAAALATLLGAGR